MSGLKPVIGLEDVFGVRARALRQLQRKLFKTYTDAGYEEVIPPLVERPHTLSTGAGSFLTEQTLVFSDPADAGLLAIRPDMTPQVARIAATRMQDSEELKLYYSGQVMVSRPDARTGSRQQWQTGVECLGLAGESGDVEVMQLAALSMHAAGFNAPVLQVGHMGLIRAVLSDSSTDMERWSLLLSRRSPEDMNRHLAQETMNQEHKDALIAMVSGRADRSWLSENKDTLGSEFEQAANELMHLVDAVKERLSGEVAVNIDAAVMPRFLYHSGIVFSGFAAGVAQELLNGGRYDEMMKLHGRDMPATGFSFDLWAWLDAV
ncbi:MAG TPA: ATP phosphoribosyltransferase regulatory subunit [Mariprofundaceae bacterium]|nr:ATP phosphoribosyltransferase regulatory subunit [Mariprofundaceae bacterium]